MTLLAGMVVSLCVYDDLYFVSPQALLNSNGNWAGSQFQGMSMQEQNAKVFIGPLLGIFCPQDIKRACLQKSPYGWRIISYLARKIFCFVFLLQLESNHSLPVPSGSNTSGLA